LELNGINSSFHNVKIKVNKIVLFKMKTLNGSSQNLILVKK